MPEKAWKYSMWKYWKLQWRQMHQKQCLPLGAHRGSWSSRGPFLWNGPHLVLIAAPSPHSQFVQLVRHAHEESVKIFVMVLQQGSLHFHEKGAGSLIPNMVCNFLSKSGWWQGVKHHVKFLQGARSSSPKGLWWSFFSEICSFLLRSCCMTHAEKSIDGLSNKVCRSCREACSSYPKVL